MFVVKLRAHNTESHFLNTNLPLNKDGNNFDKQLSFSSYKITIRKSHDCGWKNSSHKSSDVAMLGYGFGVSMYPQFFDKDSKTFQMLPRPYIRSFDVQRSDQVLKQEWVLELANRAETFLLESIESRIMSDDSKGKKKKLNIGRI